MIRDAVVRVQGHRDTSCFVGLAEKKYEICFCVPLELRPHFPRVTWASCWAAIDSKAISGKPLTAVGEKKAQLA